MCTLGKRIKKLREDMDLTQQDLGDIVELHGTNIGRIESGKVSPSSHVLLKLSIYFNVSCDWLLKGDSANTQIQLNPEHEKLISLYQRLSTSAQKEIVELIEFKLTKTKKDESSKTKSSSTTSQDGTRAV